MRLPKAPTHQERILYLNQGRRLIYGFGVFSTLSLLMGAGLFLTSHSFALALVPLWGITFSYLVITYIVGLCGSRWDNKVFTLFRLSESVDVYLPIAGEPTQILRNTWQHVARMVEYSRGVGRRLIRVYVLDDCQSKEVGFLLEDFPEFEVIRRLPCGKDKKAGNLRHAFEQTRGDWILVLDADFAPREDMIERLLSYATSPDTGVVCSPQYFDYTGTIIERGAAAVQELFYRLLQVNRNSFGASVVTGTNCIYLRQALAPHGGTYKISYSEDLHTGFQALVDGWKIRYTPEILAKGVCPDTARAFFSQQYRWCMGSTTLLLRKWFWTAPITWMQRLCYLTGFCYYVATGLGVFLLHVPSLFVLYVMPEKLMWFNYCFSLPSFLFGTVIFWIWNKTPYRLAAHVCRQIQYMAHAVCLVDKMRGNLMGWVVTGGAQTGAAAKRFNMARMVYVAFGFGTLNAFAFGIFNYINSGYSASHLAILVPLLVFHYVIWGRSCLAFWGR